VLVIEKKAYFDGKIKHTNMLHAHMDLAMDTLEFVIKRSIGELFFRDDEQFDECSGNDSDVGVGATVAIACKVAKKANKNMNTMRLFD